MMLVNLKLLRLNMNGQESKPVHALAYTKPKSNSMYPHLTRTSVKLRNT